MTLWFCKQMEHDLQKYENPHEQNEFDTVFVDPFGRA